MMDYLRLDRRQFVQQALAVAASYPTLSWAASDQVELSTTSLGNNISLINGAGGNVVVFDSPEGVLMVDGGLQQHSTQLLQKIKQLTSQSRVHTLINTHWHWEHTGSNLAVGKQGTRIISHENTRLWLTTVVDCKWRKRRFDPLPKVAQPNHTFYTKESFAFGSEQIECGYLFQAHTDGDIYVFFRNANVLVVGDVLSAGAYPIADYTTHGWIGGMIDALKTLSGLCNEQTRVIGGNGLVQSKKDLDAEQAMLSTMKSRLSKLLAQGKSAQDMIDATPTKDFDALWGNPNLFIETTWHGLIPRARELGVSIV
jgi:cyclase